MAESATMADLLDRPIEAGGFRVAPWTLDHLERLAPVFSRAAALFKAAGLTLEDLNTRPLDVVAALAPVARDIIAVSVGIGAEEARALRADRAIDILLAVLAQNLAYIRKLFGSARGALRAMAEPDEVITVKPSSSEQSST